MERAVAKDKDVEGGEWGEEEGLPDLQVKLFKRATAPHSSA